MGIFQYRLFLLASLLASCSARRSTAQRIVALRGGAAVHRAAQSIMGNYRMIMLLLMMMLMMMMSFPGELKFYSYLSESDRYGLLS